MRIRPVALWLLLGFAPAALAVLPSGPAEGPRGARPELAPGAPGIEWSVLLRDLHLEFFDPVTERTYTAAGPFEVVREGVDRVEVRASAAAGEVAPHVTIVRLGGALWAVARFADREFATRIE